MNRPLVFVVSEAQRAAACARLARDEVVLAVADTNALLRAREAGWQAESLWAELSEADVMSLWDTARAAQDDGAALFVERVPLEASGVWRHAWHDLQYPLRMALHADRMARRRMARHPPAAAWVFAEQQHGFAGDPPEPPPDLFNAACAQAAADAGVEVKRLEAGRPEERQELARKAPTPWLAWPRRTDALLLLEDYEQGEGHALIERWRQRGDSLAFVCEEPPRWPLPFMRNSDLRELPWRARAIPPDRGAFDAAWRVWVAGQAEDLQPGLKGAAGALLRETLWRLMLGSLLTWCVGRWLGRVIRPGVALMGTDITGGRRAMRDGLQAAGVPVVTLNHGGLCQDEMAKVSRGSSGPMLVWGERERRQIDLARGRLGEVSAVGALRPDVALPAPVPRVAFSSVPRPRVVFVTSQLILPYLCMADEARWIAAWDDLADLAVRRPAWEFIIKPHPRYDVHPLYRKLEERTKGALRCATGTIRERIDGAAAAVFVGLCGTAALEVMALDVPIVVLEGSLYDRFGGTLGDAAWDAHAADELAARLEALIQDPAARERRIAAGRAFLADCISAAGSRAAEAADRVVHAHRREAQAMRADDGALLALIRRAAGAGRGDAEIRDPAAVTGDPQRADLDGLMPGDLGWSLLRAIVRQGDAPTEKRVAGVGRLYAQMPRPWRPPLRLTAEYLAHAWRQDRAARRRRAAAGPHVA